MLEVKPDRQQLLEIRRRATETFTLLKKISLVTEHIAEMNEELQRTRGHLRLNDSSLFGGLCVLVVNFYFFEMPSPLWLTGYVSVFMLLVAPWIAFKSRINTIELHIQSAILRRKELVLDVAKYSQLSVNFQTDYSSPEQASAVLREIEASLLFELRDQVRV